MCATISSHILSYAAIYVYTAIHYYRTNWIWYVSLTGSCDLPLSTHRYTIMHFIKKQAVKEVYQNSIVRHWHSWEWWKSAGSGINTQTHYSNSFTWRKAWWWRWPRRWPRSSKPAGLRNPQQSGWSPFSTERRGSSRRGDWKLTDAGNAARKPSLVDSNKQTGRGEDHPRLRMNGCWTGSMGCRTYGMHWMNHCGPKTEYPPDGWPCILLRQCARAVKISGRVTIKFELPWPPIPT